MLAARAMSSRAPIAFPSLACTYDRAHPRPAHSRPLVATVLRKLLRNVLTGSSASSAVLVNGLGFAAGSLSRHFTTTVSCSCASYY